MKKAYEVYKSAGKSTHEQKVQKIVERASIHDSTFLQNPALVEALLVPLRDEKCPKHTMIGLENVLHWISQSEESAQMS